MTEQAILVYMLLKFGSAGHQIAASTMFYVHTLTTSRV